MTQMRAAQHDRYGSPDVLHVSTVDRPVPQPGELLIQVAAASVNGYDVLMRSGALKLTAGRTFPKRTGLDFTGHIVTTSETAPQFKAGQPVWGTMPLHELGSIAEYVSVAPQQLAHSPAGLSLTDAAALPVVGATALMALRDILRIQPGQRLLIRGASGGVGSIAVQLAKAMNVHVTGLASAANLNLVRELGADEALDYAAVSPKDLEPFDGIFDTVGSNPASWRGRLSRHGRMATTVPDPKRPVQSLAYFAFSRIYGEQRVQYFNAKPDTALLDDLARFVARGEVRPLINQVYALDQIADAHQAFENKRLTGKQIVRLA